MILAERKDRRQTAAGPEPADKALEKGQESGTKRSFPRLLRRRQVLDGTAYEDGRVDHWERAPAEIRYL
jgi:hypothetical protein